MLWRLIQGLTAAGGLLALLAALPWALWHYLGWPLPEHLPTAGELRAVLLGPMTTPLLLDVLGCLCWLTWAAFVIDVARCVAAAIRGLRWPEVHTRGPVHALAAILVGVIVVSLLSNRGTSPTTTGISSGHGALVATAPAANPARPIAMVHPTTSTPPTAPAGALPQDAGTVVVRAPHNGVHDSLSRIAARTLGDARRWPEIFTLNKGKPQPNGGTFTNPSLVFPGERLTLPSLSGPASATATSGDHQVAPPTVSAPPQPRALRPPPSPSPPSPTRPVRQSPPPTAPVPSAAPAPQRGPTPGGEAGLGWEPGVFLGLGLAAALSTALVVARRRYRRGYRPGSGHRDDLPVAPVVYQLRLAHLRADHADTQLDSDINDIGDDGEGRWAAPPTLVIDAPHDPTTAPDTAGEMRAAPGLGTREGREIALDLAVARGLGLVGAGALAAARALLLTLLAPTPIPTQRSASAAGARVIVPVEDLALVLGGQHAQGERPAALHVVADLDAALDELEAETLSRVREDNPAAGTAWPVMALVTRPPTQHTQRLQAVLDNGAHLGLVGVLLGQWRPGVSVYIRADGTVSATSLGPDHALLGTRMFHLPEAETADLLALLRHAQSNPPERTPAGPDSPTSSTTEARRSGGPSPSAQPTPATTPPAATRDGGADTALELTAIPSAEPDIPDPRPVPDHADASQSPPTPGHHDRAETSPVPQRSTRASDRSGPSDPPAKPIHLSVLGSPRIHWTPDAGADAQDAEVRNITAAFPPRQRELLVFLALHPDGVHRDPLVAALWEDSPPKRPTNALNTALSRLRHSVHTATDGALADITTLSEGRYRLDPHLVDVDYWHFSDAVAARRRASNEHERVAAYQRVVDCYGGCLAEGMDTEWIDTIREATRRDAIDAVAALARALIDSDPQRTLDLLETARAFDPHNELLYRDIMRLQQRLGQLDAIPRTLNLLTTRLAEIDEAPTGQALELVARLQQRHNVPNADTTRTHHRQEPKRQQRGNAAR